MSKKQKDQLMVFGATIMGFAQACINLNIVAGSKAMGLTNDIEINGWYPFQRLKEIERIVSEAYDNVGPIFERVGMEMMSNWYNYGPGKEIINKGVEFLSFQAGSQGYASVVKGSEELVGSFQLQEIDESKGRALIHSTTPWNKDMERGIIIGGMTAPGDLDYVDVDNSEDEYHFKIEFS
jgi:hypothetical protein